jgi:protein-L-isoaspartate(D-aspartate) O-methyltransferase
MSDRDPLKRASATPASPRLLVLLGVLGLLLLYCRLPSREILGGAVSFGWTARASSDQVRAARERMVREQIMARGVRDPRVLEALREVPRHLFVPKEMQSLAYTDEPLPIGYGQTISQPYVVAFMSEALELKPQDRVLEIGTGSGYQAAVLAHLAREVYSIEIIEPLAKEAAQRLRQLGYANLHLRTGDGYRGWPEAAPFDAIIVTAAPEHVPPPLVEQLREGGRLVLPLGGAEQALIRIRRTRQGIRKETLLPVRFVPMIGEAQKVPSAR